MESKLNTIKSQATSISPIKSKFEKVSKDKNIIIKQLNILQEETKLSDHSVSVMRFFSYNTPKKLPLI